MMQRNRSENRLLNRKNVGTGISVVLYDGENIESALRRFKRKLKSEQLFINLRKREHYVKPSEKRRQKRRLSKLRMRKHMEELSDIQGIPRDE